MLTGNTRSQDQITAYHPNGAIYLRDIEDLRSAELKTIYQGCAPFIMEKSLSVDIDTIEDFKLAEALLS
jgi:CMP-N-acetylneuraminic acid synthetase